jgi:hypothetical protein
MPRQLPHPPDLPLTRCRRVEPIHSFVIVFPAFPPQQHMHSAIAIVRVAVISLMRRTNGFT